MSSNDAPAPSYRAVVFQRMPDATDFTCSRRVVLPGEHSAEAAWRAIYAALRAPDGTGLIGGEVVPA